MSGRHKSTSACERRSERDNISEGSSGGGRLRETERTCVRETGYT